VYPARRLHAIEPVVRRVRAPDEATARRVLAKIDAGTIDTAIGFLRTPRPHDRRDAQELTVLAGSAGR
jgi:hypothetical protein